MACTKREPPPKPPEPSEPPVIVPTEQECYMKEGVLFIYNMTRDPLALTYMMANYNISFDRLDKALLSKIEANRKYIEQQNRLEYQKYQQELDAYYSDPEIQMKMEFENLGKTGLKSLTSLASFGTVFTDSVSSIMKTLSYVNDVIKTGNTVVSDASKSLSKVVDSGISILKAINKENLGFILLIALIIILIIKGGSE